MCSVQKRVILTVCRAIRMLSFRENIRHRSFIYRPRFFNAQSRPRSDNSRNNRALG